jgi:hypothetical protein
MTVRASAGCSELTGPAARPARRILVLALALLASAAAQSAHARAWRPPRVVRAGVLLDRHGLIERRLLRAALASFRAHFGEVENRRRIAIVDLSQPSERPRFYVLNLRDGSVRLVVTTHGAGSDPDQVGHAVRVSNAAGSLASSVGAYVTAEAYDSPAHRSRAVRLDGLDPTDSNARCRCIVMHEANRADGQNYASRAWIRAHVGADGHGQAGRSDGCFAFSSEDMPYVMWRMAPGTFIYAGPAGLPEFAPGVASTSACCPESGEGAAANP